GQKSGKGPPPPSPIADSGRGSLASWSPVADYWSLLHRCHAAGTAVPNASGQNQCGYPGRRPMLKEFREFALKGNLVDLAIGFVIGAGLTGLVPSLVAG